MKCIKCGYELGLGQKFCPSCGSSTEKVCSFCGSVLNNEMKFCPKCGRNVDDQEPHRSLETNNVVTLNNTEESAVDNIINAICRVLDIESLTDDQYRNQLVKRKLAYNLFGVILTIADLGISFRVYTAAGLGEAIISFLLISIVFGFIAWLFGIGKCEKQLDKYDRIVNEVGKETAIIAIESNNKGMKTGCLITCSLILVLLVLMSFC